VAGGAAAGVVSWFLGRITLNLKGDYFCIATLGFGEAIRLFLANWQGLGGARGWPGIGQMPGARLSNVLTGKFESWIPGPGAWVPGLKVTPGEVAITVLVLVVLSVIVVWNLINSRHGRNMVAIREEELAAQMAGIDVFRYKMIALIVSAAFAGMAGCLLGHWNSFIQPKVFSSIKSTELAIIVIFGGLGSISGSVVGAVLLTALPELLRGFEKWRLVAYGLAVILIMVGRPQGLMGGMELTPSGLRKARAARAAKARLKADALREAGGGDAAGGKA